MERIRRGTAGKERHVPDWRRKASHRWQGKARSAMARRGAAPQARRGKSGSARDGTALLARQGGTRRGEARQRWLRKDGSQRQVIVGTMGAARRPYTQSIKAMTITYNYRRGAEIESIDAQTAGEELARITEQHGGLTSAVVVDESRPDDAPLHPAFEWDDAVAAELHRQHQADALIKSVQVVREKDELDEPVFVKVRSTRSYQPTEQVIKRLDLYEEAFRDACERLGEAQAALKQLVAVAARLCPEVTPRAEKAAKIVGRARDGLATGRL